MKKKMKKLALSRETLRSLTDPALPGVVGGDTAFACSQTRLCTNCPTCVSVCETACPRVCNQEA